MIVAPIEQLDYVVADIVTEVRKGVSGARITNQINPNAGMMADLPEFIEFEIQVIGNYKLSGGAVVSGYQALTRNSTELEQDFGLESGLSSQTEGGGETSSLTESEEGRETESDNQDLSSITNESETEGGGDVRNNRTSRTITEATSRAVSRDDAGTLRSNTIDNSTENSTDQTEKITQGQGTSGDSEDSTENGSGTATSSDTMTKQGSGNESRRINSSGRKTKTEALDLSGPTSKSKSENKSGQGQKTRSSAGQGSGTRETQKAITGTRSRMRVENNRSGRTYGRLDQDTGSFTSQFLGGPAQAAGAPGDVTCTS